MPNPAVRPGSEEEWEALMRQLRQQPKAQPRPFFYARVRARLPAPSPWLAGWGRLPAYLALLGLLTLAVSGDGAMLPPTTATSHYDGQQPSPPPLPH
ncbi:MAG: hypothetical protein ACRYG7_44880 [Janthinobacterium lividum]